MDNTKLIIKAIKINMTIIMEKSEFDLILIGLNILRQLLPLTNTIPKAQSTFLIYILFYNTIIFHHRI